MRQEQQFGPGASWIIASRTAVLSVALLAASACTFFYSAESANNTAFLYRYLIWFYVFTGASAIWLRHRKASVGFYILQTLVDTVLVTGAIYATGGPTSPFLFLYLPVVMASAIFVSRSSALFTALLVTLSYSTLTTSMLMGRLRAIDGGMLENFSPGEIILQVIGLGSASVLIAVATYFLSNSMKANAALASQREERLKLLNEKQQLIFDRLPEGVISIDMDNMITGVNDAARQMLSLDRDFAGTPLKDFQSHLTKHHALSGEMSSSEKSGELSLTTPEGSVKLQTFTRALVGNGHEQIGKLIIFQNVTHLRSVEEQLAMHERMARLLAEEDSGNSSCEPTKLTGFVGESAIMKKVFQLIERASPSDATVLISGESGTGKELVARAIHLSSPRASRPFVPVNCGAIPEQLLESEFFGHKKGSFTGAVSDTLGLFRQAENGTLFLDEVGELPLQMQAKLLRAIQEKSVRPIGGETSIPANVRIIAATNRNLKHETEAGKFREDLFYRLNVITVHIPPLRDRKEDLPILIRKILKKFSKDGNIPKITPKAMELLMKHSYPGNVRELENILERAVVMGGDVILPEHLPDAQKGTTSKNTLQETQILYADDIAFPVNLDGVLENIEQHYLKLALKESNGVKKTAAELLGMNFRSFRYRLQKFEIDEEATNENH